MHIRKKFDLPRLKRYAESTTTIVTSGLALGIAIIWLTLAGHIEMDTRFGGVHLQKFGEQLLFLPDRVSEQPFVFGRTR